MIFVLCQFLASAIQLFSLIIFVRLLLTWIPSLAYSKFARFLAEICDPYLNWFHRFHLVIGNINFSSILAIGTLMIGSSIFSAFAMTRSFSLLIIFGIVIQVVWSLIDSLLFFAVILFAIRCAMSFFNKDSQSQFWLVFDKSVSPFIYRTLSRIFGNKYIRYSHALLIFALSLFAIKLAGNFLIHQLFVAIGLAR
ncbi:MAG: YggT family protein [Treponemataceae bacterium]